MNTTALYNTVFEDEKYNARVDYKVKIVLDWREDNNLSTLLDVGCGRGHYMRETGATGLEPSSLIAKRLKGDIINSDIQSLNTKRTWQGLYCMDVLEHISYDEIDKCLEKLAMLAPTALYGIANHSDVQAGVELHLIQEDAEWWLEKLQKHYKNVRLTYEPARYMVIECSV